MKKNVEECATLVMCSLSMWSSTLFSEPIVTTVAIVGAVLRDGEERRHRVISLLRDFLALRESVQM